MQTTACIIAPAMERLRIGLLGSGRGSNAAAILRAARDGTLPVEPVLVLSDNPDAGILDLARAEGVEHGVIREHRFRTRLSEEVEKDVASRLLSAGCELVVLAGYMRLLKAPLLSAFPQRIINIHPSLLPKFPGLEAWRQALDAGEAETGCTVHYVDGGMDTGTVIRQSRVPVLPGDTAATLHARIQAAEHQLYPAVLRDFAEGRLP